MQGASANSFAFTLNGERVSVRDVAPDTTLLSWLRGTGRVGTKCGCNEGDCGACTVILLDREPAGRPAWRAINSCIALLPMFADRTLLTVEGLARGAELHPTQRCMVKHYGSQCGYCTPGFVMSLFEAFYRADCRTCPAIADQLAGNLCRCTGYRPIRDAALELAAEPREDDSFTIPLQAKAATLGTIFYQTGEQAFIRPTELAQLLALRARLPQAVLVAGATEIGVLINKRYTRFPLLISTEAVPELRAITATADEWQIGAAATLTEIEVAFGGELHSFAAMLRLFASRQIRSRATLGGNLVTASPIGDSAPVLLSLDASVVLASSAGERTLPLEDFFLGYRRTALAANEVLQTIIIPRKSGLRTEYYKVSKRREMDISAVAAAFAFELDATGKVIMARIAYAGVAPTPVRARRCEELLLGRRVADATADVEAALARAFTPISDARGSADFRQQVIVNLWRKFVRGETDESPAFIPSAAWTTEDPSRALPHESAMGHVTGRAEYVDDKAEARQMLELWPVCAPCARAKILRRDAATARAFPGVHKVLLAEDVPGDNNVGVSRKDEVLLANEEVFFHGQIIAIVVAETLAVARAAADLVEVEYAPLPAIVTIPQAIAAGSFHTDVNTMRRGEWRAAMASCAHTLEGSIEIGGQEHFYLETQAAWAEVDGEGNVFVVSSTQHPSEIQTIVAEVLHLPRSQVVVQAPRMGGGFGGKETQGNTWAALVALAALKCGRPVRVQLDRDLDLQLTGKRHPFFAKFQTGFESDGKLVALHCDLISNGGWSLDLSLPITERAMFHIDNAYYVPNLEVTGQVAKTNLTSQTAFRGFGGPQGMLVIEEILARIARRLRLPPEAVRERNFYHGQGETNTTHYGEEIGDHRLQTIWTQLRETSDYHARRAAIDLWNAAHPARKRGLAITPVKFGISFTYTPYNQAGALVLLYRDGTVQVNHGGTEMGQGLQTKILGIAMRELGLPQRHIRIMTAATDKVPNTSATAASSGSDLNGAAVRDACTQLRDRLTPFAIAMLQERFAEPVEPSALRFENAAVFAAHRPQQEIAFLEVVDRAYMERVSLSATGYYATPGLHWDRARGQGRPFHYFACGAAASEVEVDGDTGASRILRVDILHDTGDSLNPGIDRGQIEGGFVQGAGWLTSEDLCWNAEGILLSHSASTYQIPAFSDAPADFRVALLPKAAQPNVIHGSKAVGEPPLMLALSVREAIRDAVAAFAPGAFEIRLASPATPEATLAAITQARSSVASAIA